MLSVVVMVTLRPMDMGWWFLGRRGQLPGEDNTTGFVLLGQVFGNLGVIGFDIADHAVEEAARLEVLAGKVRQDRQRAIENFRSRTRVGNLLGLLLNEGVIFLFKAFGKDRHWSCRHVEGT